MSDKVTESSYDRLLRLLPVVGEETHPSIHGIPVILVVDFFANILNGGTEQAFDGRLDRYVDVDEGGPGHAVVLDTFRRVSLKYYGRGWEDQHLRVFTEVIDAILELGPPYDDEGEDTGINNTIYEALTSAMYLTLDKAILEFLEGTGETYVVNKSEYEQLQELKWMSESADLDFRGLSDQES